MYKTRNTRIGKGKSIIAFPNRYVVIDIETTGLDSKNNNIIEIAALRYENGKKMSSFQQLICPNEHISSFITNLTGISDEMVKDCPDIYETIIAFKEFVGDDILVGYNVNFDINFLYDHLKVTHNQILNNDFVDVLRLARRVLPFLDHHRQTDVASYFGIDIQGAHRAEKDCLICQAIYEICKKEINNEKM